MVIADLHIHSRFSRATSRDCDAPHLDFWARRKGIQLIGTGDFTHPAWRAELKEHLTPAEEGLYVLRKDLRLPGVAPGPTPRFVITGEISSIYRRDGKTRKVHSLILLPSLAAAEEVSARLAAIGNLHSDGRPILGLDCRDLLALTLEACPQAEFIPAHIWTPHFSLFGAFSGFDAMEDCFGDLTSHIHAVETGLSSDPPMNWRISALDGLTLVSHSDAHSPAKLGREADLLDIDFSYPGLIQAIRTGEGMKGTLEFFPEEGKYHLDGHRNCGVCLTSEETARRGGLCPVCGRKLTIGVEHRVAELADRPVGFRPPGAKPFESLAPLSEVIAASTGISTGSQKTGELYERMLRELGPEFSILRSVPLEDAARVAGPCVAEGLRRLRAGQVTRRAGFDGEYGSISLLTPGEIQRFSGQISLFGEEPLPAKHPKTKGEPLAALGQTAPAERPAETFNAEQWAAVTTQRPTVAVIAGPGTGKTKTLVSRIAYLVEEQGVRPEEITAVTFTNQAASELRQRLEKRLGGKRAAARLTIGTFHGICLRLLGKAQLLGPGEALTAAAETLRQAGSKRSPKGLLQAVSQVKNGASPGEAGIPEELYAAYCARLEALGALDFDDLLTEALKLDTAGYRAFTHLLVDEFQDLNDIQYTLLQAWRQGGKSLFVIGDPDQSIYGFRGAHGRCFARLTEEAEAVQVTRLARNYRSTPEILAAALPVIEKNPGGPRTLSAHRPAGLGVRLVRAADDFAEGIFIAKEIDRMVGGVDMLEAQKWGQERPIRAFSDIAVLCRTHRQLELLEQCLQHDGIPCVVSGRGDFWEDDEARGALAFWRSLEAPEDRAARETALRLLWNCPDGLIAKAHALCARQKTFDLEALQEAVQGDGPLEAWLARTAQWLPLPAGEKPWRMVARWEEAYGGSPALERLRNTAVFHATWRELWNALVLGQEADLSRASGKDWASGAVRLMTLHGAKGLEFPAVFVAGVRAGALPLETQSRKTDRDEERRLLYVGMTRAKEELILTTSQEPSPFLDDLPDGVAQEAAVSRRRVVLDQISLF